MSGITLLPEDAVFSVSEFLDFTNELLKPLKVTVQGEITSVSRRDTATYFSLTDKKEKAKLECVIWQYRVRQLPFALEEGQEIQVVGAPNIYKPYGKFSLVVNRVSPVGEGALRQAFEKLRKKLQEQGFFAPERKKTVSEYPERIGLVTSEFGDAIKDFRTHLGEYGLRLELIDTRVEGLQAIDSIVSALRWFNEQPDPVEVIVLTRGGGSLESLQAFNSEEVAKAIFASRIPVVSAIGHENDLTIADLVADVRASTPTDAGKMLGRNWADLNVLLDQYERSTENVVRRLLQGERERLRELDRRLEEGFLWQLRQQRQRMSRLQALMLSHIQQVLSRFSLLSKGFQINFALWRQRLLRYENEIVRHEKELLRDFSVQLVRQQERLKHLASQLQLADPEQKLKQGYSIVTNEQGKVVTNREQVAIGQELKIRMHQALVYSKVERVK